MVDISNKFMNILYCAYVRERGFIRVIHRQLPPRCEYEVIHEVDIPFDFLEGRKAVVIVGKWVNIFSGDKDRYFKFLEGVHQKNIPIAAILGEREILPGGNNGIDIVIARGKDRKSLETIIKRLRDFLNIRKGVVYSTE